MKAWTRIFLLATVLPLALSVVADEFSVEKNKTGVTVNYDGKLLTRYVIGQSKAVSLADYWAER